MPEMPEKPESRPIFPRGSNVLAYWLVHAEGLTVEPSGATVEHVVKRAPFAPTEALVVRSPLTGRRRTIAAADVDAVEPSTGTLLLRSPSVADERRVDLAAAARAAGHGLRAAARAAGEDLRAAYRRGQPVARRGGVRAAALAGASARSLAAAARWAAPRLARCSRAAAATAAALLVAALSIAAHGIVRASGAVRRRATLAAARVRA
jgi:hypothetical protein